MTISTTNKPNWTLALGIPLLIFLSCFVITFSSEFKNNNGLISNAILIDLLFTAPLAYYIVIRKSYVSKLTVSRVFICGLVIAGLILNAHSNTSLQIIKTWISPLIEGMVIIFIGRKFYISNKKAKNNNINKIDFLLHCRSVMYEVTGSEKAGNIISSEIAVLYYAFIGRKDTAIDYTSTFTSYKENGLPIVLGTILSIFLIETIGMHFLLSLWNQTIAWTLTGLGIYTCIQLYAHIKAIKARSITINTDSLEIHNGLAGDAYIEFGNIEKIEMSNKLPHNRYSIKIALIKGLEGHNMIVYLKNPIEVTKMFGMKRWTDTVLFFVDRPNDFLISLNTILTGNSSEILHFI